MFDALNGQLEDLRRGLHRTRRDLIALAGLISAKGVTIQAEEWEEASRTIEAGQQIDLLFDPRAKRGEEFMRRVLSGEEIPEDEMTQWLRDVEGNK